MLRWLWFCYTPRGKVGRDRHLASRIEHRRGGMNRRIRGFGYIAVISIILILMVLVVALDYQGRSSRALFRMDEARLYRDLAARDYVGKKLTTRTGSRWPRADLPISVTADEKTNLVDFDQEKTLESWEDQTGFPSVGSYPEVGQKSQSLGQTIASPGIQSGENVAYPGQTVGLLKPKSNNATFAVSPSRYRMSLVKGFPFAVYAPQGNVTILGRATAWPNPTDPELDETHQTLDFASGFPFRVGAKGQISVADLPYGEAHSKDEMPRVKGGGIAYRGYLPYQATGPAKGYAQELWESIQAVSDRLSLTAYNKSSVIFGTLSAGNVLDALFGSAKFDNFLTYEQSTRFWFFLIPGFKSRGPAIDITLHAPLRPDGAENTAASSGSNGLSPEALEAQAHLEEVTELFGQMLLQPADPNDPPGTQPLIKKIDGKETPDFDRYSEIMQARQTANDLQTQADTKRAEKSDQKTTAENDAIEAAAQELENQASKARAEVGFADDAAFDRWLQVERLEQPGKLNYAAMNSMLKVALDDLNEKKKGSGLGTIQKGSQYDPGPNRTEQAELKKRGDMTAKGRKGTNLWLVCERLIVTIANLVKDIAGAFYDYVFVEVDFGFFKIPLPNPVKLVKFFFVDGDFGPSNDIPDLLDIVLNALKNAVVQEVTLVYLGKDDEVGSAVPIRIDADGVDSYNQSGDPGTEAGFSIHNTFTVPAGRTFKIDALSHGMTIEADLWLQRGSVMVVNGDLTLKNPARGLTKARGKLVMEPGSTLVVKGNFTAAGDPLMGSVLLARMPGRVEPITSSILCSGAVLLPHGMRSGLNLVQLLRLVSPDLAGPAQDLLDDVMPNVAKILGPFHARMPFLAEQGATFTFYFPVIVPNPIHSMLPGNANINVKIFRVLSPMLTGSLNMTLGENFFTGCDWWMLGEDRVPVLPKLLPGAARAARSVAVKEAKSLAGSVAGELAKLSDANFFLSRGKDIVVGEFKMMLDHSENLAGNIDDVIANVAGKTLTETFTVENVSKKVVEIFANAAKSAANPDPTGLSNRFIDDLFAKNAPDSLLETLKENLQTELSQYGFPINARDYLGAKLGEMLAPLVAMSDSLKAEASQGGKRVAGTLLLAETPGLLVSASRIQVDGLYASGLFVARGDITMNCAYVVGSMISMEGNISAHNVLYTPEFTHAEIFTPPVTVETPSESGLQALPEYWADALGLNFGSEKVGKALNYGNGTGPGSWTEIPSSGSDPSFEAAGGWVR